MASLSMPTPLPKLLFLANALWFTNAFIQFTFRPGAILGSFALRKNSKDPMIAAEPEGDAWHHDISAYLGGLNTALATLAFFRLLNVTPVRSSTFLDDDAHKAELERVLNCFALTVLSVANGSQAYLNFRMARGSGRWIVGEGADVITVGDAGLCVLDLVMAWRLGL